MRDLPWTVENLRALPPFEFENWAVMMREDRTQGFFVAFDYTQDALAEIQGFLKRSGRMIRPITVRDILDEQVACKLA